MNALNYFLVAYNRWRTKVWWHWENFTLSSVSSKKRTCSMGAHRHEQERAPVPLWKCCKVFYALVVTAQRSVDGDPSLDPTGDHWLSSQTLICPPLEKILRAPMHLSGNSQWSIWLLHFTTAKINQTENCVQTHFKLADGVIPVMRQTMKLYIGTVQGTNWGCHRQHLVLLYSPNHVQPAALHTSIYRQ